jgi:hypothetical protein
MKQGRPAPLRRMTGGVYTGKKCRHLFLLPCVHEQGLPEPRYLRPALIRDPAHRFENDVCREIFSVSVILEALIHKAVDIAMILLIQRLKFPHSGPPGGMLCSVACLPGAEPTPCDDRFTGMGSDRHYYVEDLRQA